MTPEVSDRLARLLDWLESSAKSAEGFALEQAPLVAREIVSWTLASSIAWLALCLAAVIAMIVGYRWLWKASADSDDPKMPRAMAGIFGGMALAGLILAIGANAQAAIKASVAPRLVIIDYVRGASK